MGEGELEPPQPPVSTTVQYSKCWPPGLVTPWCTSYFREIGEFPDTLVKSGMKYRPFSIRRVWFKKEVSGDLFCEGKVIVWYPYNNEFHFFFLTDAHCSSSAHGISEDV